MRKITLLSMCAGLLAGGAVLLSSVQEPGWKVIGPGGGGAQYMPTISPHDPKKLLVACDMTGSYFSENGGTSWHMFNLGGTTRFFEWDPNDARVVYAGNIGLFRSGDGG